MTSSLRLLFLTSAVCTIGSLAIAEPLKAADMPATAPATQTAVRSAKQISSDMQALRTSLTKDGPFPRLADLMTPDGRAKFARFKDPLVKLAALQDEFSASNFGQLSMSTPGGPKVMMQGQRILYLAMADSLGSDEAAKQLAALAASSDQELAVEGKMGQNLTAWLLADSDAAEGKVLDAIEALAKDHPDSNALAMNLRSILIPTLPPDITTRIDAIFNNTLTSPVAHGMQAYIDAGSKQKNAVGKPLVLAGKTSEGKDFSTKQYAGKVVLVDFWATWCGPCKAELPRIKAIYDKYHDQGLEVVGVSCDGDGDALASYTKENNMPWVELWDKQTQSGKDEPMHALAVEWKVNGIPQMFVIDRNGILRSVDARKNCEILVPSLLDEKPPEAK